MHQKLRGIMKKIVEFFTTEHLLGNLITFVVLGLGIVSLFQLRREVFPQVEFDVTTVSLILPGASPEQVEKLLVTPIEEAIREVDGIKKIYSTSTEGTGVVILQLDPDDRDPDDTNDDIQFAIDSVKNLPEEAEDPIIRIADTSKSPILEVSIYGQVSDMKLRQVSKDIRDELLNIDGVASITRNGFLEREILIEADPKKLARARISLTELINAIAKNNVSLPAGSIKNRSGEEVLIKTDAELLKVDQVLKTPIISNDEGIVTYIGDVASVKEQLEEPVYKYRANGESSINLVVLKKQNADVIRMVDTVKERVNELKLEVPKGIQLGVANDFSIYVRNRISVLGSNLAIGLVLVVLVLTMLLPLNVSLVVAFGIPVALFSTIICMNLFGISVNMISLIGMIIVLGMVVDDAIVVCENIWRNYELGKKPLEAVVSGVSEVIPPVFASVLTTILAFAPLAAMSGIMGKFIFQIPIIVILALIFSLLEAVIVMPSHFSSWVPSPGKKDLNKKTRGSWFDPVVAKYGKFVSWSMHKRYIVLLMMVFGFAASGFVVQKYARFELFPAVGVESFFIKLEAPQQFSLENTEEYLVKVEQALSEFPKEEITDYISMVGISRQDSNDPLTKRGSNYAQVQVILTPENQRDRTAQDIIEILKEKIRFDRPDVKANFVLRKGGPPQGRPISIDLLGDDYHKLNEISKELITELKKYKAIQDIESSYIKGKTQFNVKPIMDQMAAAKLTADEISLNVRAAFDGVVASSVRDLDDELDIRVRRKPSNENADEQLKGLSIGNSLGNLVRLDQIASFEKEESVAAIFHKSYKRQVNVSSALDTEFEMDGKKITSGKMISVIQPYLKDLGKKYPEIKIEIGGENEDTQESMASLMRAFMVAFVGIAALLIVTFRKLIQPVIILFTIPMGVIGVVYALLLHGKPLSFMSMLGVVALSGVIVNNAIVLITFINQLRQEDGLNRYDSIIEAAKTRLRPIFMTTLTTVSGLLPTAYGLGGSDPFIKPLALSLGWGLAIGSLFIAIFFPAIISLLDDFYYVLETYLVKRHNKNKESLS